MLSEYCMLHVEYIICKSITQHGIKLGLACVCSSTARRVLYIYVIIIIKLQYYYYIYYVKWVKS